MIFITIKKKITVKDGAVVGKWQPVLWLNTGITANTVYGSKPNVCMLPICFYLLSKRQELGTCMIRITKEHSIRRKTSPTYWMAPTSLKTTKL